MIKFSKLIEVPINKVNHYSRFNISKKGNNYIKTLEFEIR